MLYYSLFSKFLPYKYYPYRFPGGKIYLNINESPMMLQRAIGLYERKEINVIRSFLKPGMTFIDVGCNKGDFSLIAARVMDGKGSVIAFEPEPTNYSWIKSIELNGYKNIRLFRYAIGECNELTKLYLAEKSGWHSLVPSLPSRNAGFVEVEKRTIDDCLKEINCKSNVVLANKTICKYSNWVKGVLAYV